MNKYDLIVKVCYVKWGGGSQNALLILSFISRTFQQEFRDYFGKSFDLTKKANIIHQIAKCSWQVVFVRVDKNINVV